MPVHENFMDAWKDMYAYVKRLLDAGQMSYQVLETAIWIETIFTGGKQPIMFYDARDIAIRDFGWTQPKA